MTAFYSLLNRSDFALLEGGDGDDISVWIFALLAAAGGAAAYAGGKRMKRLAAAKQSDIEITFEKKSARLRAMTDTGNLLTDPLSGRGVALCELEAVKDIFPCELIDYWRCGDVSAALPSQYAAKLRFIPARGATDGKNTLIAAILPDSFSVTCDGIRKEADLLVAPVLYNLSAGESRALLPAGII